MIRRCSASGDSGESLYSGDQTWQFWFCKSIGFVSKVAVFSHLVTFALVLKSIQLEIRVLLCFLVLFCFCFVKIFKRFCFCFEIQVKK